MLVNIKYAASIVVMAMIAGSAFANGKDGDDDQGIILLDRLEGLNRSLSTQTSAFDVVGLEPGLLHALDLTVWASEPGTSCSAVLSLSKEYEDGAFLGASLANTNSSGVNVAVVNHDFASPIRVQFKPGTEKADLTLFVGKIGVGGTGSCRGTYSVVYENKPGN